MPSGASAPVPEPDLARWLVGDDGLATVARLVDRLDASTPEDQVLLALRATGLAVDRAALALEAAQARRRARGGWPDAERLIFTRRSLEQATRPALSEWKARRYAGRPAVDLCAGAGGDAIALARTSAEVVAVEADPGRAVLLGHNHGAVAPGAEARTGDALDLEVPGAVAIHVDPDRRANGRRLRDPSSYRPGLRALDARFRATNALGVTIGPGVDLDHPSVADAELEFLQVGRELVEAVRWTGDLRDPRIRASATLLPEGVRVSAEGPSGPPLTVRAVGGLLLDPAPALVRARLHDREGERLGDGVGRVAVRSALLTADDAAASPWFVRRQVLAVLPARARAVRAWLAAEDPGPIEIALAGLAADPEAWWRELGRPPRGPGGVRLDLVRLDRGGCAVLSRLDAGDRPASGSA